MNRLTLLVLLTVGACSSSMTEPTRSTLTPNADSAARVGCPAKTTPQPDSVTVGTGIVFRRPGLDSLKPAGDSARQNLPKPCIPTRPGLDHLRAF